METTLTSLEVGNQLVSIAFTEILFQVQQNYPHFYPYDNTIKNLFYSWLKCPKCSFAMVTLDGLL